MAQEKVRVVIEIRGGCLQAVYAGDFVEVVVVDWDNIEQGDTAGVWDPTPEPAMSDETREQVLIARGEVAEAAEDVGAGMCAGCQRDAEACVCEDAPEAGTPDGLLAHHNATGEPLQYDEVQKIVAAGLGKWAEFGYVEGSLLALREFINGDPEAQDTP